MGRRLPPLGRRTAPGRIEVDAPLPKHGGNIMKKLSVFLALLALFFADLALAAGAVITSTPGTVSGPTAQAPPRPPATRGQAAQGGTVPTATSSASPRKSPAAQLVPRTARAPLQ